MKAKKPLMAITWSLVIETLERVPAGCTNRQLAELGPFDYGETCHLTRIMWKAGELSRELTDPAKNRIIYTVRKPQ